MTRKLWFKDEKRITDNLCNSYRTKGMFQQKGIPMTDLEYYRRMNDWFLTLDHVVSAKCDVKGRYIEFESDKSMIMFMLEWK